MAQGTLNFTNNSTKVTGTGTSFISEIKVGDFITATINNAVFVVIIKEIKSDTELTLTEVFYGPTSAGIVWDAVPMKAATAIPYILGVQTARAARLANLEADNWLQVYTALGDITVTLPDGTQFTGPSWKKLSEQLNDVLLKSNNLADVNDKAAALKNLLNNGPLEVDRQVDVSPPNGTIVSGGEVKSSWSVAGVKSFEAEFKISSTFGKSIGAVITVSDGTRKPQFVFNNLGDFSLPGNIYLSDKAGTFGSMISMPKGNNGVSLASSSNGSLGILNVNRINGSNPVALFVDGGYHCKRGSTNPPSSSSVFNINWTGSLEAWIDGTQVGNFQLTPVCDGELKKKVAYRNSTAAAEEALARVLQWRVATFRYIARGILPESETKLGFIANDLVEVSPLCVKGEGLKPGYDPNDPQDAYSLDTTAQIAELTQAVQALAQQNIQLRADIDELKAIEKTS
jgi:hypothetical protein